MLNKVTKSMFSCSYTYFLPLIPMQSFYICVCLTDGSARNFSLPPYAGAGIQTHISRVALTWDLLKDALLTELSVAYFNWDEFI